MPRIAWRSLRRRKLRTFFTATAIALGVANVFGVFVTNESMQDAADKRASSGAGGADAMFHPEDRPWLTDDEVERIEALPDVRRFMRWGTYKELEAEGRTDVFIQGVDIGATRELIELRSGRLPKDGAAEVALTVRAAKLIGAGIGDRVKEATPKRPKRKEDVYDRKATPDPDLVLRRVKPGRIVLTVTAIVADYPLLNEENDYGSFTSNEFLWDIEEPDRVSEVGILLERGTDPADWTSSAEVALPHLSIRSGTPDPFLREFLTSFRALLTGTAALALFIGAFLIYLIFTLALAERTRLVGLFHAVGASPAQVATVVLTEALLLGVASTIAGIVLGIGIGWSLLSLVARIGVIGIEAPLRLTVSPFIAAVVVGIVATLVGAAVPAVRAARATPVEAVTGRTESARRPRAWYAGLPFIAGGIATISLRGLSSDLLSQMSVSAILLGAVFVVPLGVAALAATTRGIVTRLVPGSGIVVFRHLTREAGRSSYTLSLVMLVLAAVVALMSATRSLQANADRVIDARFGADLIVNGRDVGELAGNFAKIEGVSGATTVSFGNRVGVVGKGLETANVVLIEPAPFFDIAGFPWEDGNDADARRALDDGTGVLLPSRLAARHELERGDEIILRTAAGDRRYEVSGSYGVGGPGEQIGVVANASDDHLRSDERTQSAVYMNFEQGTTRKQVLDRTVPLLREHGGLTKRAEWSDLDGDGLGVNLGPYFAISGAEMKEGARRELGGYVRLFSAVIGVIVIAGALGMATALATSVVLRTRELGTLQAIGGTRSHIRRMVVAESVLLTSAAYLLSLGLGFLLLWAFIGGITEMTGSRVPIRFAWSALPFVAVLAMVIALAAAMVPARRAAQLTPVEALRYE